MKRYKEYKDSGVQWIGEIPIHWDQRRVRYTGKSRNGLTYSPYDVSEEGEGILVLRSSNIQDGKLSLNDNVYVKKDISPDLMVKRGDILICSRNGSRDLVGKLTLIDKDIEASFGAFMMIYRTNMWAPFMEKVLSVAIQSYKTLFSTSTINQLTNDIFKDFVIPIPPLAEQEKIVNYIESKTSKIDEYIAEKEKEVQLLNELKEAEIAKVVTQGLNPNVKMKDSGVSWIRMIPENWDMKRAKYMFTKNKRERRPEDEVITCFRDGQVTLRKNRRLTGFAESEKYDGYQGIRKGDLVIHQMDAFAGSIGVSDSDGMGTSVYHCCTPIGDYNVYYYAYLIRQMAMSGFIQSLYKGIRERSSDFSFPVFGNQYLAIPSRVEQDAIVAYINEKTAKVNSLITELQAEIDYLKEYKQRLIADCVTGQMNVQNV